MTRKITITKKNPLAEQRYKERKIRDEEEIELSNYVSRCLSKDICPNCGRDLSRTNVTPFFRPAKCILNCPNCGYTHEYSTELLLFD